MTVFYFTATGNCLAVAKRIGGTLVSIPQVVDSENLHYKDDAIGIVFPVYGWTTPVMVGRFLDKVRFEADYIFAIGTYGNIPGAAMHNLQKRAVKNGYRFDYTNQLLMVDNFLPIFEMGAQMKKLPNKKVEENTAKIVDDIKNLRHMQAKASPVIRAISALVSNMMNSPGKTAQKYIVNDQCNKCGICAKVCPAKNITVTDKIRFADKCEYCLACPHLCPRNAIHLKNEKSDKRWINPEVSLNEIIKANNRGV
ncbi:MAG: EFR1 family ferrodoxin [Treponema sp.]|nr:EFR1 family ferrodoxin [Treponema sp.]